jgi:AraC family transcriptional regulator of adaptative response/methylated-DNA-[protein]-cysteine methyltransferase
MILCSIEESPFGKLLIASEGGKVGYASFMDDRQESLNGLRFYFLHQQWELVKEPIHKDIVNQLLNRQIPNLEAIINPLGTEFQRSVWRELIKIPFAETRTYLQIAIELGSASSARAVGTAIGANPIAWLIPCHRVIQTSGGMGGYRWGLNRKKELLSWEKETEPYGKKTFTQARLFPDKG